MRTSTWTTFSATPVLGMSGLGGCPVRRLIRELLPPRGWPKNRQCMMVCSRLPFFSSAVSNAFRCRSSSPTIKCTPYSAYISQVFNFANLESFAKLGYFCENFDTSKLPLRRRKRWLVFQYFKKVDGNYPGTKLPDPQGALSKEVPSSSISAANTEIVAVLQPSAASAKAVRGTYLKISAEKKAKIGQRAAEHGVLVTVRYYVTKLPVPKLGAYMEECSSRKFIVGVAY